MTEVGDAESRDVVPSAVQVHVERADPDVLATWGRLRDDLSRLMASRRAIVKLFPSPKEVYRAPPVDIRLSAIALSEARYLHDTYGDFVTLHVGALPYPPPAASSASDAAVKRDTDGRPTADPGEISIVLDGPIVIASGDAATHDIVLTNRSDHHLRIHSNGHLTATIVDDDGNAVGGYTGVEN